ncbi:subtilisin-like protease SBT3 [Euphorbia lathyris]|uniref:subtilisin-like protease SBT3 n=1 Tax=Euphorbia lathyris TaxID=212925 RepID=UPI0033141B9C
MFYNIDLEVWLALTTAFTLFIPALVAQTDTYIIHMDVSAMPKAFSTQHSWHLATLSSVFTDSTATTSISAAAAASSKLLYSYTHAINGFSACLTPWELDILKASPGYISAFKDVRVEADTTRSTSFLGLNPKSRAWKNSNYGEGMIIGVVDSGVWPESESYSDKGMSSIPKRWRGECESGTQFNSSLCNKKLIGARSFNKGVIANDPNVTISMNSTRDTDGHGTHTSSTAAGNFVEGASYFGYAMGTARGVAPRSHVAVYKALWDEGTFASDIIAAIDQAIIDQVDVLSISLSVFGVPFYEDPIALATFAAVQKNIVVAGSAGNRGSSILTIRNAAPWVLTVAASTIDRKFNAVMKLGDGVTVTGLAIYPLDFPSRKLPIVFTNGACSTVAEFSDFDKSVVVCEETIDTSLEIQFGTVGATNVTGGVFITNSTEFDSSLPSRFPAIFLNFQNGQKLKKYINASTSPQVSIKFKRNSVRNTAAPSVAAYSSRGPSRIIPEVLKPDIMAPGTQILAAWPEKSSVGFKNGKKIFSNFEILSGTSMACPHAAGVAALLKKAHPDWSPAAIKSAMMTTADTMDRNNEPIKDLGLVNLPATPVAMGSGHINPNKALNPGLIYDLKSTDYVKLLCALNYTQSQIQIITKSPSNDCSSPSLDINYPSFIAFFNGEESESNLTTVKEFHRTVTNVGDAISTYTASWTPINGLNVSVVPKKLQFKAMNEKLTYKLVLQGPKKTEEFLAFGQLSWVDSKRKHIVRSPIVVASFHVDNIG